MPSNAVDGTGDIGARIRAARTVRGLSVRRLAGDAGVSPAFVSHLENGRSGASISTLRRMSRALGLTVAELIDGDNPHGRGVLRHGERTVILSEGGLTKYLLSSTPLRNLEVYLGVLEPGAGTGGELYTHGDAQEMLLCLRGAVDVAVGDTSHHLEQGDLVDLNTSVPHGLRNNGAGPAEVLWIISPPTPD
jgi:transcriptional regulator with XRE-family HTH domain